METVGIIRATADMAPIFIFVSLPWKPVDLFHTEQKTVREPIIVFYVVSDDLIAYIHTLYA